MSLAWISSVIDWDTCKIQFEVLGDSLDRIAATHGIPVESLQRIAREEEWKPLEQTAAKLNEYLSEVLNAHRAKLSLAALYRDMELHSRVTEAENQLLTKVSLAIVEVDPGDPRAASALRALGQSLNTIAERKVAGANDDDNLLAGDTHWTIDVRKSGEIANA